MLFTFWPSVFAATPLHHYAFNGTIVDLIRSTKIPLLNKASLSSGALSLDGVRNYVELGDRLIPTQGPFSVAFFAAELSPTSDRAEVISQGTSYGPGFYVGYYPPSRVIRIGDDWQNTGVEFPEDGLWHHYAVTVDGTETRLYIDGILRAKSSPIRVAARGNNTRLGQQFDAWGEFFHGYVDELWIFSGALNPNEVAALARAGTRPVGRR